MLYPKSNSNRDVYNLNGVWEYRFVEDGYLPTRRATDTKPMAVPASFNEIVTDGRDKKYCGNVLYERDFSLPVRSDKIYRIRLGATSHKCKIFLNGEKIGDAAHVT